MNGAESETARDSVVHVNGAGSKKTDEENNQHNEDEVVDPEILAAIAASKQDIEEEEVDPAVLAAIEASKKEVEEEKKKESKGPILMFSTLGRNEEQDDAEEEEEEKARENDDDPGDLDPEEEVPSNEPEAVEEPTNGEKPVADDEGNIEDEAPAPSPVWTDPSPVPSPGPVSRTRGKKDDHLTPTLRRAYITKVKPEKRYCSSDDDSDGDWGGGRKKKKRAPTKKAPAAKKAAVVPSGPSAVFKCPNCALTFETIGQLNVHKHSEHGEEKPTVLDMGEAVIARLQEKSGSPKDRILKEILSDFADVVEDADKVGNLLGIALVEGIEYGRLRQGTSGKKNWNNYWLQENAKKRKTMMDKWLKEPSSVGDCSTTGGQVTVNIIENSGEFMAIKEKLEKYNIQVTTHVKKPEPSKSKSKAKKKGSSFDDDDDIEIVSEKISQKTKLKLLHKKKMQNMKPKAVIKVNSAQGKQMLKTIVKTGKVPFSLSSSESSSRAFSKSSSSTSANDSCFGGDDEEDDGLTCPSCFSAFWYPTQTYEHMSSVHNIENPEKYMKEKKRSRI